MSLLLATIFLSCGEDEMPEPLDTASYEDIDVITGLDFFDENGNPIGRWKSPNHKPGEVAVFPNPNLGIVSLYSLKKVVRVWLVPANCISDTVTMDIPVLTQSLNYSTTELEGASIIDLAISDFNNIINLNFRDVNKGFYKLFYQLDSEELLWQNMFIDPTVNNIPNFSFLDDECQ